MEHSTSIIFPTVNASLNGLAGIFLLAGFIAIKKRSIDWHKRFMTMAFCASALFLVSYLTYHFTSHTITRYHRTGFQRILYFTILLTHTPLATLIVPFSIAAVYHALKGNFQAHVKITKWLWPTWMYVSVTGVIIYLMLYIF